MHASGYRVSAEAKQRLYNSLQGIKTILILSSSFILLSQLVTSTHSSLATSSSLNKLGPIQKITSAFTGTKPSTNATRLQLIRNNVAANVEKIKNIVNTTLGDVRNTIKKTINETRNALLGFGIKVTEIGSIVIAAIAAITVIRQPWLRLDKTHSPLLKRIELAAYDIDDTHLPLNLRTFKISYSINRVVVRNRGWKAAKNCKGILKIGNEEVKVYWYTSTSFEKDGMTINRHSAEYLDLFAIFDGETSEIFNNLSEHISKLKDYVNGETFTDVFLRQGFNATIDALSNRYKSAEDIPRIIIQDAADGWNIARKQYYNTVKGAESRRSLMTDSNIPIERIKDITKVIVTSENARRLQESITILDRPADNQGTAIRF